MKAIQKRRFIKDPVWGHVEFFPWEREILNHELVNRLHGICQNSCTNKVYPSLHYSRFSHSIGAMHVATQLFINIARNLDVTAEHGENAADQENATKGRAQLAQEIKAINERFKETNQDFVRDVGNLLSRSFPVEETAGISLAVVRLGALLHDIGHLPYSHLFEHTLEAFTGAAIDVEDPAANKLRDELREAKAHAQEKHPSLDKFHELLGFEFAEQIAKYPGFEEEPAKSFVSVAIRTARDLWAREITLTIDHANATPIISSLLSGEIDADRIDFVRRDSYFSGLFQCSVDFNRLFDLYEAGQDDRKGWSARPSGRSTSDASKLLIERYQLYKYVVAHHRVHLFDELLERLLIKLLREGTLNGLLETLRDLLTPRSTSGGTSYSIQRAILGQQLLYLDDSWVDARIKQQHADYLARKGRSQPGDKEGSVLSEAFVEQRSLLKTVFKWDRDFKIWWDNELYPWLEDQAKERQQLKRIDQIAQELRAALIFELPQKRYAWERELCERTKCSAIILGGTGAKVKKQMKNAEEAEFFGLTTVHEYLTELTDLAMVFNAWFIPREQAIWKKERDVILRAFMDLLAEHVLPSIFASGDDVQKEVKHG